MKLATDEPPEMMLTVRDVAELLAVGVRTVWRWANVGRIPRPIRLAARTVRWRASDIQAYIDSLPGASRDLPLA